MSNGYQDPRPGRVTEITAPTGVIATPYRGFQALVDTTMSFRSDDNVISERTYLAMALVPATLSEVVTITGAILAYDNLPTRS